MSKMEAFSFPGGYRISYLSDECLTHCADCAGINDTAFIHWEGDPMTCDGCQKDFPSEYGPIDDSKLGLYTATQVHDLVDKPDDVSPGEREFHIRIQSESNQGSGRW